MKTAPLMPNKSADAPVAMTAMVEKIYAYFIAIVDIDGTDYLVLYNLLTLFVCKRVLGLRYGDQISMRLTSWLIWVV